VARSPLLTQPSWRTPPGALPDPRRRYAFGRVDRGLAVDLVELPTADGHSWDGLLLRPRAAARGRPGAVVIHGSVGNFLAGVPRRVALGLAHAGHTVLSANTRMANFGTFFGAGLLHRTPLDLDAALAELRRRGHRRIVLVGFSMGATMVTHYQALRAPPEVVGLLTLAHPRSLPASLRRRWTAFGARPGYEAVERRARPAVEADPEGEDDSVFVVRRASGPTDDPAHAEIWTLRTWWSSRGPESPHAVSAERIRDVRVPVALVQAERDELVAPDEGPELARIARAAGVPEVELVVIPEADHVFTGREDSLVAACAGWLERFQG
jgi:dienelactone hydrolase